MKRIQHLQKGQSLVEVAISLVFILMVLMGLFDIARLYYIYLALEDSAGEAALFLSINPYCRYSTDVPPTGSCADPNNAESRAKNSVGGDLNWDNVIVTIPIPGAYAVGERVEVTMTYEYEMFSPFIPSIAGVNPFPLSSRASQIIIRE